MHRFFVKAQELQDRTASIVDADSIKKARQVLRMQPGDKLQLFDGEGTLYSGEIKQLTRELLLVSITDRHFQERDRAYFVLSQALPRAGKLDTIVKMCTEIGVDEFIFFPSARSVGHHTEDSIKLERFMRIAIEAARQSERLYVPGVAFSADFEKLLHLDVEQKLVLSARENEQTTDIRELPLPAVTERVIYFVGPEGGFSPAEMEQFSAHGFANIYMNLPVLRVETAAVAASTMLLARS